MDTKETTPAIFVLAKNALGVTSIVDTRKKGTGSRGAIAIFFQDQEHPARTELYARTSADALNQELARRAHKD